MYSAEALEKAIAQAKNRINNPRPLVRLEYLKPLVEAAELALDQGYYESEYYDTDEN